MTMHIVQIGHDIQRWGNTEDTFFDRIERIEVEATSEDAAMTIAAISAFPGTPMWAQEACDVHYHYAREARDCDGLYTSGGTHAFPAKDEEFDDWGIERTPNDRLASMVARRYVGGLLRTPSDDWSIKVDDDGDIHIWERTDEGYVSLYFHACDDRLCWDHIEKASTFRDHTAERAGY